MAVPERANMRERAVLWRKLGLNTYAETLRGKPVEIRVRWESMAGESIDPDGNVVAIDAQVFLTCEVGIDDILWLGPVSTWAGTSPPAKANELMQVRTYNKIPSLKGHRVLRVAGLVRYRGELPEQLT